MGGGWDYLPPNLRLGLGGEIRERGRLGLEVRRIRRRNSGAGEARIVRILKKQENTT